MVTNFRIHKMQQISWLVEELFSRMAMLQRVGQNCHNAVRALPHPCYSQTSQTLYGPSPYLSVPTDSRFSKRTLVHWPVARFAVSFSRRAVAPVHERQQSNCITVIADCRSYLRHFRFWIDNPIAAASVSPSVSEGSGFESRSGDW